METSIYPPEYMEAVYTVRTLEKERRALSIIKKFGSRVKNAAVAFSGKDSLVALHLTVRAGLDAHVVVSTHVANRRLPQEIVET